MTKSKLLEWSDILKSTPLDDEVQPTEFENYLFETQRGIIEYEVIEEEMAQLNDYCLVMLEATGKKLEKLKNNLQEYKSGKEKAFHQEWGDLTHDMIIG